jgi:hypothetical protein
MRPEADELAKGLHCAVLGIFALRHPSKKKAPQKRGSREGGNAQDYA